MNKKIAIFGGNQCFNEQFYFGLAYETGKLLAKAGFVVITGAGAGLMDKDVENWWLK